MQAIVYERYGPPEVLSLGEVPVPEPPDAGLLLRVRAVSLNRSDWETLTGSPAYVRLSGAGLLRPKRPILGTDVAGIVEDVGPAVTEFRLGDEVLGDAMYHGAGCLAEYAAVPERAPLVRKPDGMSFEVAACLPQAGILGLQGVRGVTAGQRVLVNGAGGGGGTFAVQLAKLAGAEVTGVDSAAKHELMRSLGADHVVDYAADDYTRAEYDRILDFVGSRTLFANRRALAPGGLYQVVGGPVRRLLAAAVGGGLMSLAGDRKLGVLVARPNRADLARVAELVASGAIRVAIDRRYELGATPEALARLGAGEALGKLVVTP